MIDALLFAIRDGVRAAGFGYGVPSVDITAHGEPNPKCGNIFVAISEGETRSTNDNTLMEYFAFNVTLTQRVAFPLDRAGDQQMASRLASRLARVSGKGMPSFNARLEQLRGLLHMAWALTVVPNQTPPSANDNIVAWSPPGTDIVYGFVEPARYRGAEKPVLVGPDWFGAEPAPISGSSKDMGLKAEMRFDGARRMQNFLAQVL